VEPQQDFLQQFRRVELIFGFVIALVTRPQSGRKGRTEWDSLRLSEF
jgi:hypothetical protein